MASDWRKYRGPRERKARGDGGEEVGDKEHVEAVQLFSLLWLNRGNEHAEIVQELRGSLADLGVQVSFIRQTGGGQA